MAADFSLCKGDSRQITVTVKDQNGTVINLTGATIRWVLLNPARATLLYKDNTPSKGITITDAVNGLCSIKIDTKDTQNLSAGSYSHEARVIDSNGNSSRVFKGTITVEDSNV